MFCLLVVQQGFWFKFSICILHAHRPVEFIIHLEYFLTTLLPCSRIPHLTVIVKDMLAVAHSTCIFMFNFLLEMYVFSTSAAVIRIRREQMSEISYLDPKLLYLFRPICSYLNMTDYLIQILQAHGNIRIKCINRVQVIE